MSYRLLALDMDGTLLASDLSISQRNQDAIRQAMAQGIVVTLVTGRTFPSAQYHAHQLGLSVPIVGCNGAFIRDTKSRHLHHHRPIPLSLAKEIARQAEGRDIYVKAYVDDVLLIGELDSETMDFAQKHRLQARSVGKLSEALDHDPTMMVIVAGAEHHEYFRRHVFPAMGCVHGMGSGDGHLDIVHKDTSKAYGLQWLANSLGLSSSEVAAVGNAENDLAMIQWAGLGVAVANADPLLKAHANLVLDYTNDQDSIAELIHRYLLS